MKLKYLYYSKESKRNLPKETKEAYYKSYNRFSDYLHKVGKIVVLLTLFFLVFIIVVIAISSGHQIVQQSFMFHIIFWGKIFYSVFVVSVFITITCFALVLNYYDIPDRMTLGIAIREIAKMKMNYKGSIADGFDSVRIDRKQVSNCLASINNKKLFVDIRESFFILEESQRIFYRYILLVDKKTFRRVYKDIIKMTDSLEVDNFGGFVEALIHLESSYKKYMPKYFERFRKEPEPKILDKVIAFLDKHPNIITFVSVLINAVIIFLGIVYLKSIV